MPKFKARILPDHLTVDPECVGHIVPLLDEHQIYGDVLGSLVVESGPFAIIESDALKVGDKLSAGAFVGVKHRHYIREVSRTTSPKFANCEVLEVVK